MDDTRSSTDGVSSAYLEWEQALEAEDHQLSKLQKGLEELERREAAPTQ